MIVYLHVACMNHFQDVVDRMMDKMKKSGMYDQVRVIYVGQIVLRNDLRLDPKMRTIYFGQQGEYEYQTLSRIKLDDVDDDEPILYLHSKGVTKPGNPFVYDWTEMMTYYLIEEWRVCVQGLKEFDTVGVNLHSKPNVHYSGNMWWTTPRHLRKIGPIVSKKYLDAEYYVTQKGKHLCLWQSDVNHYHVRYPPELYRHKLSTYQVVN